MEIYGVATAPYSGGGLAAPIGSLATENSYLYQKYNSGATNWGIPLLFDPITSHFRNPLSYLGGSFNMAFNTGSGKFSIGDLNGVGNGSTFQVQDSSKAFQFIVGGVQRFAGTDTAWTYSD